jgi:hypothetical protein
MTRILVAMLGLIIGSCAVAPDVRGDAAILPGANVSKLLDQCSRHSPARGEATWQPEWQDIQKLEAVLPAAVEASSERGSLVVGQLPVGWRRQYVGIVRNGERFIYGNFYPLRSGRADDPLVEPFVVCDGGPAYFGVEYDLKAGRISHLAFNGP